MEAQEPTGYRKGRQFTDWQAVAQTAREHPGEWFKIGPFSHGMPYHIRKGTFKQFLDPEDSAPPQVQMRQRWQVTSRKVGDEKHLIDVFVKYVG
jgi:hypothetical protein